MGNFYFGHFLQILQQVYIPKHLVGEVELKPEKKNQHADKYKKHIQVYNNEISI